MVREKNQQQAEIDRLQGQVTEISDISDGWRRKCERLEKDIGKKQDVVCELEEELCDFKSRVQEVLQVLREHGNHQVVPEGTVRAPKDNDTN